MIVESVLGLIILACAVIDVLSTRRLRGRVSRVEALAAAWEPKGISDGKPRAMLIEMSTNKARLVAQIRKVPPAQFVILDSAVSDAWICRDDV